MVRDDIYDVGSSFDRKTSRIYEKLLEKSPVNIENSILAGNDIDDVVSEIHSQFHASLDEDDDEDDLREHITPDFIKFLALMHLNGTPLADMQVENLGVSCDTGDLKIRDMSRFVSEKVYGFSEDITKYFKKGDLDCTM